MQDETMVVLAEYNTITEAEIAKSMLDSAGIWSMIRNEYMSAIYPIGTMPAQVVVRPRGRREGQGDASAQIKTAPPVLRQAGCRRQRRAVRNGAYRHRVREGHASAKGVRAGCTYTLFDFTRHAVRRRTGQVKLIRYS